MSNKSFKFSVLAFSILSLGIAIFQYFYNRSLWHDEVSIALNIIHKNSFELLKPLDYGQVAPILYLEFTNFFTSIFPQVEYGLRIFPLICFGCSIFLFFKIASYFFENKYIKLSALAMFCLMPFFIYYASEVKQYMSDLLVALLIIYAVIYHQSNRLVLLAVGLFSIALSNVSVIMLCSAGLYLTMQNDVANILIELKKYKLVFVSWSVFFAIYYLLFIHNHPSQQKMQEYWKGSFITTNVFSSKFWAFLYSNLHNIFSYMLTFGKAWYVAFGLFIIGCIGLITKRKKKLLFLVLFPVLLHLLLSSFKLYPFGGRLILYQLPLFILGIIYGIQFIFSLLKLNEKKEILQTVVPFFIALFFGFQLFRNLPLKHEEIKESINFINENFKDNEQVYIYYGAVNAYNFYNQIGIVKFNTKPLIGSCYRGNEQMYIQDILQKENSTIWVLFSHPHQGEDLKILKLLDSKCTILKQFVTEKSSAYLLQTKQ